MKYQTGKIYIHPDMPGSILAEVGKYEGMDADDYDRLQFYRPDMMIMHRMPKLEPSMLMTNGNASVITAKRILFKRIERVFTVWECVAGDYE